MKTLGYIILFILCCMLMPVGCSDDLSASAVGDGEGSSVKVVLYVPYSDSALSSRGNPEAGEDGNGREQGMENENALHDVNLFFFKGSGLNPADASAKVTGVFIPSMQGYGIQTESLPFEKKVTITFNAADTPLSGSDILDAVTDVSFITVLNAGKDLSSKDMTLADLRELIIEGGTWTASEVDSFNAQKCDGFVMTTAYDADRNGFVEIDGASRKVGAGRLTRTDKASGESSETKPGWLGETTVQRMCARIDVMYGDGILQGEGADAALVYPLVGGNKTGNLVHITNILPVNVMRKSSYLLTKVTDGIPTDWTKSGLGSISWGGTEKKTSGSPANYVIEPNTLLKEVGTGSIEDWYGDSRKVKVKDNIKNEAIGKVGSYFSGLLPTASGDSYYSGKSLTKMTVIGYANENIQSPTASTSDFMTGLAFRALYQPRKWTALNDGGWTETVLTDAEWTALTDKGFTLYSPTVATSNAEVRFFANNYHAWQYQTSHPTEQAILTRFDGGVCYYNLWIRHYNDIDDTSPSDPHEKLPMEYAIVRNNIYRVALTFSGPGTPDPEMREPDTMMARIFVRKWNLRQESSPLQF